MVTYRIDGDAMDEISEDAPLRLKNAIKIAFPCGGMTESGLRQEHQKGRLKLEKIAGKHFVTLRAIKEMRELCEQVPQRNVTLPPRFDLAPPKKRTPGVIYACDIPEEIMRKAMTNRLRGSTEAIRKGKRTVKGVSK